MPKEIVFDDELLYAFCMANPELRVQRDENQQLIIMSPTGSLSGKRYSKLLWYFGNWNEHRALGSIFDSSAGFSLPDGSMRAADIAWVSNEKWDGLFQSAEGKICSGLSRLRR